MTEQQWHNLSERIQREADKRGLLNPLDILIHFFKPHPPVPLVGGVREFIHRNFVRLKAEIVAAFQPKCKVSLGSVILFPIEPTHVNQMAPVISCLISNAIPFIIITTRVPIFRSLREKGLPVHILTVRSTSTIRDTFLPLKEIYRRSEGPLYLPARQLLSRYYRDLVSLGNEFFTLLKTVLPTYILIGNDLTWEGRLLARLAAKFNYRTGMIQHGLLGHEPVNKYHIVQDFFVYGPAFKAILLNDGLEGVNVIVTGAPYLDEMRAKDTDHPHPEIKRRFRLRDRFVLVALSGFGHRTSVENYRLTLEWINRMIRNHPELEFVIKLHRKERIVAYKDFSGEQKSRIVDNKRGKDLPQSIFDWLKGCSCLITGTSTVAYEAMLCGVPVVSVDPLRQFEGVDFIDQRAVEVAYSYEEMEDALLRVNGTRGVPESFIKGIFARGEMSASQHIANHIRNFIAPSDQAKIVK